MLARAAPQAASDSKGLVLALLVDGNKLSLRELVLCFMACKTFRELLDGRGFCIGTAWLCAYLESGQSPAEILSRLWSGRRPVAYERLSRVDQITRFLKRDDTSRVRWGWEWAQLLYQEPDGGMLCEGVKNMLWMFKGRLINELNKCSGYYPGLCTLKGHSRNNPECTCKHGWTYEANLECPVGHLNWVRSVAWSPDGKTVASGSDDRTVRLWDVGTGKEKCSLKGHSEKVTCVAWSPDCKQVASCSWDRTVRIWDVSSGKETMGSVKGHSKDNPECTCKHGVWVYEANPECPVKGHSAAVNSVAFSPDGKYVASGSGKYDGTGDSIRIWDVATGKEAMGPLTGHSYLVRSVAWSPCGNFVASGSDDSTVKVWNIQTGSEKCSLTGHSYSVTSVAWSPCGKFVASGSCDETKIWDVVTGSEKCSLKGTIASWQNLDPHTKELASKVKQGGDTNRTGQYIVTADRDMVYVYLTSSDGEERDGKEPLACFRSPAWVDTVSCMGTSVVVGCSDGQELQEVLFSRLLALTGELLQVVWHQALAK